MVLRTHIAQLQLSAAQVTQISLTSQQVSFLSQQQKKELGEAMERIEETEILEEGK